MSVFFMPKLDGLFLALYCLMIFMLSHQSALLLPMTFPNQDKLIHASAYAVMAWFTWRAFRRYFKFKSILVALVILFCSTYGASDEFHQSFIEGRDADIWDWLADTVGAGFMASVLFWKRYKL